MLQKLGLRFHGEAKLYGGKISGLSNVRKTGAVDCSIQGNRADFIVRLSIQNLEATYTGHIKLLSIGPSVSVTVTVYKVSMILMISQEIGSSSAKLESVTLNSDSVKLQLGDIPLLSSILAGLTSPFVSFFKTRIHRHIEPALERFLKTYVSTLDIRKTTLI